MIIRVMTIEDYDRVFRLWRATPDMGLRSLDDSREGIQSFLNRNPATNFVAEAEGELAGAILCGHDGRRGYIYHTVVSPQYRGQDVATRLADAAAAALRQEGITRVCLNVTETNQAGKAFWEKLGWEKKDFLGFYSKAITQRENAPLFTLE